MLALQFAPTSIVIQLCASFHLLLFTSLIPGSSKFWL